MKTSTTIGEAETSFGTVRVEHHMGERIADTWMTVSVNGVVKHDNCTPTDVIRALCHYLNGAKK